MNRNQIPAPRVPFIDQRSGQMAREWYLYLLNIMQRTDTIQAGTEQLAARSTFMAQDGEDGEEGVRGIQGAAGPAGNDGRGVPGNDGEDAEPPLIITGPQGKQGERGPMGFGQDGEDGEDAFIFLPPTGPVGFSGTITSADLATKTITVVNGVIASFA